MQPNREYRITHLRIGEIKAVHKPKEPELSNTELKIRNRELERENAELRQANEILKDALGFFAKDRKK